MLKYYNFASEENLPTLSAKLSWSHYDEILRFDDINEIARLLGVTIGNVNKEGYKPCSTKGRVYRTSCREEVRSRKNIIDNFNSRAFENEVVVFTGKLSSMGRSDAMILVRRLGGTVGSSVTKKTTILVTNIKDIENLRRSEMSNKLRKAVDLKEKGQSIKIIDEVEFLNY